MCGKASILFVDDEPRILNGLGRMLRSLRREWDMAFAVGGAEALAVLEQRPFDVIVSDMRMPGLDGVELLTEVRARHPRVVRLALSGQASKGTVLRSVGLVHRYLAKPCEAETLKATVAEVCALRELVPAGARTAPLLALEAVPSLPLLHARLLEQVASPEASIPEIGQTVSHDIGMAARVLQLVGSAFFGQPSGVFAPAKATVLLGLDVVKSLATSSRAFSAFSEADTGHLGIDALWRHGRTVGEHARAIALAEDAPEAVVHGAYAAGLLHDVGKVIRAATFPEECGASGGGETPAADQDAPGRGDPTHVRLGAYLMGLWGLPPAIVDAIAFHHEPSACVRTGFTPLTAVHAANAVARAAANRTDPASFVDRAYLSGLGLLDRLGAWREVCQAVESEAMAHV